MNLHGLYVFNSDSNLNPYIGGAFGVVDLNHELLAVRADRWLSAYEVRGGLKYSLSQKLFGNVEYQWTDGEKPHFSVGGVSTKIEFPSHGFLAGMNYKFH